MVWRLKNLQRFEKVLEGAALGFLLLTKPLGAQQDNLPEQAQRAKQAMTEGRYDIAISLYQTLVREVPSDPGMRMNLGMALHGAGRYRDAVGQFQAFLKQQPGSALAWFLLGLDEMKLNEPALAVGPLTKGIEAKPDNTLARLELARAFYALGRLDDAESALQGLTRDEPKNAEAWQGLFLTYNALANRMCDEVEKAAPASAYSDLLLGRAFAARGEFVAAFNLYKQAMAKTPQFRPAYEGLAEIYRRTRHPDWAAVERAKENALPPLNSDAAVLECEFRAGHFTQLISLAKQNKSPESDYWRACGYEELGQLALERLEKMPPSSAIHDLLAEGYQIQGNYGLAVKEWREALKLAPNNPNQKEGLAQALWLEGEYREATSLLAELINRNPNSSQLNFELGDALLRSGSPAKAIPYLERAISGSPSNAAAHASLGKAFMRVNQPAKAIAQFKAALRSHGKATTYYELANAYEEVGQKALAAQARRRFEQICQAAKVRGVERASDFQVTPIGPPETLPPKATPAPRLAPSHRATTPIQISPSDPAALLTRSAPNRKS